MGARANELGAMAESAAEQLSGVRVQLNQASALPARPGLYALWVADGAARGAMGLSEEGASRPLYVGKATNIRRRVSSYLSNTRGGYMSFREYVRRSLLTASHMRVPEWILFGAGASNLEHKIPGVDLGRKPHLAFDADSRAVFNAWLATNVTVSSVLAGDPDALEGPVIHRLEPTLNQAHMATVRSVSAELTNWTDDAVATRFAWDIAAGAVEQLCSPPMRRRAEEGNLHLLMCGDDYSYPVEQPDPGPNDFAFHWVLDATVADQRERSIAAMDSWAGGLYATPDELLNRLGPYAWAPGFIHRFFEKECPGVPLLIEPLRPLTPFPLVLPHSDSSGDDRRAERNDF